MQSIEKSSQSYSQARALYWCAVVNQLRGEYRIVTEMTDQGIESARRHGLTMVEAVCRILSISAHADLGESGNADELGEALNDYAATGAPDDRSCDH